MKISSLFLVGLLALAASNTASAVTLLGQSYTPSADANYTISAVQGIDASNPLGKTGVNPQVNRDFEFQGAIGVSYDTGGSKLTDFGLGLYTAAGATQSTGLRIDFNSAVTASSIVVTLEDFDIKAGKDTFFNPQKVEPTLLLLGDNNTILGKADPTKLFSALTPVANGAKGSEDTWNLDFSKVLANLNLADGPIRGFILGADMANGEKANSDPYLLLSVGNAIPAVPEADTYMVGLFGIGVAFVSARKLKRRAGNSLS
jgi:hypothetical protein